MVYRRGTVKIHDNVLVGLKLDGEPGKMNVADKWKNGLCARNKKTSILTPCPTALEHCSQTPNILFGN